MKKIITLSLCLTVAGLSNNSTVNAWSIVDAYRKTVDFALEPLKQTGRIVKSTKDSYYDFKGKVRENQLEGRIKGDFDIYRKFVINLSSDGLAFQGKAGIHHLKGKRKTGYIASTAPINIDTNEPWTGVWDFKYYHGEFWYFSEKTGRYS